MKILFLCVANSARSQMAEGLAKNLLGSDHLIESAGSEPSGKVHPDAITAMSELGIDISSHRSKSHEEFPSSFYEDLDFMITLCAEEVCPVLPSPAKKLHWALPDPAAASETERLETFRKIRDDIKGKISGLKETVEAH